MTRFYGYHHCGAMTVACLVAQLGEVLYSTDKPAEYPPRWFIGGIPWMRLQDVHRLDRQCVDAQTVVDWTAMPSEDRLGCSLNKILCAPDGHAGVVGECRL